MELSQSFQNFLLLQTWQVDNLLISMQLARYIIAHLYFYIISISIFLFLEIILNYRDKQNTKL